MGLRETTLPTRQFVGAGYAVILAGLAALMWLLAFKVAELWLALRDAGLPFDGDLLLVLVALFFAVGCLLLYRIVRILEWMEEDVRRGLA